MWVCCKGCFAVVRTYGLTLVAAENPAVKRCFFALAKSLDCGTRDATRSVYMSLFYSTIGARVDATTTLAATHRNEWFIVVVTLFVHDDFAKQYECAKLGRYEQ